MAIRQGEKKCLNMKIFYKIGSLKEAFYAKVDNYLDRIPSERTKYRAKHLSMQKMRKHFMKHSFRKKGA